MINLNSSSVTPSLRQQAYGVCSSCIDIKPTDAQRRFQRLGMTILMSIGVISVNTGCSFNFELTSQKTALENQVMGSYKELDDDVIMMASVRGVGKDGKKKAAPNSSDNAKKAVTAKQNQDFNRDDIDELKQKQIVGEGTTGELVLLPKDVGLASDANASDLGLAQALTKEENRDRDIVIQRIITSNENLTSKDLVAAKKAYQRKIVEESPVGTWVQDEDGKWQRKRDAAEKDKEKEKESVR